MKRLLSAVIALAMILSLVPMSVIADGQGEIIATHYYGDADFNEVINTADAAKMLKISAGSAEMTDEQKALTYEGYMKIDADKDGRFNTNDASYVLKISAGMKPANEYYEYAPTVDEYTVTFKDGLTGDTISEIKVSQGADAVFPDAPEHAGYQFTGWDRDGKNITADTVITAQYEILTLTVTFSDGLTGDIISTEIVEFGGNATFPQPPEHDGYAFVGWDKDGRIITADTTITAQYVINTFVVTFIDGITGGVIANQTVEYGQDAVFPEPPIHVGYSFMGWDKDGKNITDDTAIIAQYDINKYTVTFVDGLTGEMISEVSVAHGKDATFPMPPSHEGYTFTGWDKDGKNITDDVTITAQYKINVYTVTFVDGLTGEVIATQEVEHGQDAVFPEPPVHEGETFSTWSMDGKNITADTTITALYSTNYFTVTYVDGLTGNTISTERVEFGHDANLPAAPVHEGYTFTGWDKDGKNITGNTTITARYEINVYTVTFVDSFTGEVIDTQKVEHGKDAALPEPPVHEGETFFGWSSDGKNITADITIKALYSTNVYAVTYVDGLTGETIATEYVEHGNDANFPGAPVHEGYTFTGWDKDGKNITDDVTITAQYSINFYTVTFVDGLTGQTIETSEVAYGSSVMFPREPVHDGYTFTGWDSDGTNITCDTTITAQYALTTYTVTFVDGVTGEIISTVSVAEGADAEFPEAPVHEGYDFKGWDKDGKNITEDTTITATYKVQTRKVTFIDGLTGETIAILVVDYGSDTPFPAAPEHEGYICSGWDKDGKHVTEDITITALYTVIKYIVTFIDGLTGDIISQISVEHGHDAEFPNPPAHEGYRFTGWDKDGKNIKAHTDIRALYSVDGIEITLYLTDALNELEITPSTATMVVYSGTNVITNENVVLPANVAAWGEFSQTVTVSGSTATPASIIINCGPTRVGDDGNTYFILKNMTGFRNMDRYLNYNYVLTFDIDLNSENFKPFGYNLSSPGSNPAAYLEGIFDGDGHTIENLYIWPADLPGAGYATYYDNVGLFSGNDGVIKNLYVTTGAKTSTDYGVFGDRTVGIIAGRNYGRIENCHVYGNAGAVSYATAASGQNKSMGACGGICGANIDEGVITRCSAHCQLEGYFWLGGIVGKNWGTVSESYFAGSINPWMDDSYLDEFDVQYIGGICGGMTGGSIENCYVYITDGIIGTLAVGGLVGWINGGVLRNDLVMNINSNTIYCYLDSADYFTGWVQSNPSVAAGLYYSENSNRNLPSDFGAEWDMNATEYASFPDLVNNRRDEYFIW